MTRAPIEIRVPGDKSLSHRALIFAALASGRSRIRDVLLSADVHSTAGVLRALGVSVPALGGDIVIDARGARAARAAHRSRLRQQRHDDATDGGRRRRVRLPVALRWRREPEHAADEGVASAVAMGARVDLEAGDGLPMVVPLAALAVDLWDVRDREQDQEAILSQDR